MRKQISKIKGGSLIAGILVVGLATGLTAFAASSDVEASGALTDSGYSLNDMLIYAIEDEHLAQAEYAAIINEYGNQRPFSNIINAEENHISLLEPLFEEYGVTLPNEDWDSMVSVPDTIDEAFAVGIEAEEKNIAMYEDFLNQDIPDDVKDVFERLMNASEKHLTAFERQSDGNGGICDGSGYGNGLGMADGTGTGYQRGRGNGGSGCGNAINNRTGYQGSCMYN